LVGYTTANILISLLFRGVDCSVNTLLKHCGIKLLQL